MNKIALSIIGISELKADLANLPVELRGEARNLIEAEANAAAYSIRQQYPIGETGNLVKGVEVRPLADNANVTGFRVLSLAPHAWWYEYGTAIRKTKRTNAERGRMGPPRFPTFVFIRAMLKARAAMENGLREFLVRHGLKVSG